MKQPHLLYRLARTFCRIVTTLMFRLHVYGAQHVPSTGGVLVVCNHQSYLDPVVIGVQVSRQFFYMAKSELFVNRFFGGLIRRLGAFPVRQGSGDISAVRQTIEWLQSGRIVTMFVEGTRTPDGRLLPLEPGFALIVRRAGVPVVPAVVDGSFDAWPRDHMLPGSAPIRVMFGPAMHLAEQRPGKIVEIVDRTLHQMLETLRTKP